MKKSLADKIEQYLKVLIERSGKDQIEIQRSELAETFGCVPSQVTYVISTRFTREEGFLTESRRGGKGFVRIARCSENFHADTQNKGQLLGFIDELTDKSLLNPHEGDIFKYLISYAWTESTEQPQKILTIIKNALDSYLKDNER